MSTVVRAISHYGFEAIEADSDTDLGGPGRRYHKNNVGTGLKQIEYDIGSTSGKVDKIYSDSRTLAISTPWDINLTTQVSKLDGTALAFLHLQEIHIRNLSTTATLLVGGGSNPITSLWGASGDIMKILPSTEVVIRGTGDGYAVVATTGDILRLDPGASAIPVEVILVGRSA